MAGSGNMVVSSVKFWNGTRDAMQAADIIDFAMIADCHHVDCDFRNSTYAAECAEIFGTDDSREVFPCNLNCEGSW